MALRVALPESEVGAAFPEAYAKIKMVQADSVTAAISVSFYANEAARRSGKEEVLQKNYPMSTDNLDGKLFRELYLCLKTIPDFLGAVDVFEGADIRLEDPSAVVLPPPEEQVEEVPVEVPVDPPVEEPVA